MIACTVTPTRSQLMHAALAHAESGMPVFRLRPGTKEPFHGTRGFYDATTDANIIRELWEESPDANIGIPTGSRSGLLVLDVDADGFASLDALEEEHGKLPSTAKTRTGGGGVHILFKYPAGSKIRNSVGKVGIGLDVRGEGGYIVAPPSQTDKGPYTVLDKKTLAEPPGWFMEAARVPHKAATDEDGAEAGKIGGLDGEHIPFGKRGDTLFRIACSLRARGSGYGRILSEIRRVNREWCSPPIGAHPEDTDPRELEKIAESVVSRYPAGDASPEPPPEVLESVEALYSGVLEHLEWTGRAGPTDRAVYAALLITARRYGHPMRSGVKVYVSVRALALTAGVSKKTAGKALDRLRDRKLVYRASEGRGVKAGALILKTPQKVDTLPVSYVRTDSGLLLRDVMRELLRLRWGPGRVGKTRAFLLEVIAQTGEATLSDLSKRTGRRRDNVRRALRLLEERTLVECSGETYSLVPEFADALDAELEKSGVKLSERLDRQRYRRQQEAFREAWAAGAVTKSRHREFFREWKRLSPEREADGFIEALERVEPEEIPHLQPEPPCAQAPVPDAVITDAKDPEQLRRLAALARERIAEHRRNHPPPPAATPAARLLRRLRRDAPDRFAAFRLDLRRLAWELWGQGWTQTVYSGNTMREALQLLEPESMAM